jgi:hypothetical protein
MLGVVLLFCQIERLSVNLGSPDDPFKIVRQGGTPSERRPFADTMKGSESKKSPEIP